MASSNTMGGAQCTYPHIVDFRHYFQSDHSNYVPLDRNHVGALLCGYNSFAFSSKMNDTHFTKFFSAQNDKHATRAKKKSQTAARLENADVL